MTTDRASIFEGVQIGLETTSGGSVAANKKLNALSIQPGVKAEVSQFRPMGVKYPTLTALGKEWVEASLEGQMTYSELIYPLASLIGGGSTGAFLGASGAASAWNWSFAGGSTADTAQTFSVEQGSSTRAARFTYGLITGLSLNFTRSETTLSGTMLGNALVDGITLSTSPTDVELKPLLASQVDVYLDDTAATLGDTKLTRALAVSWELTDKYSPLWAINSAESSFAAHVESEPKLVVKLKLEADSVGMGLLTTMRAGSTKWMQILATGAAITGTYNYQMQIDTALQVTDVSEFSDEDGVFAIEWTFTGIYNTAWGKAFDIDVVNQQATL